MLPRMLPKMLQIRLRLTIQRASYRKKIENAYGRV
jgi:hypothetical protein